MAADEGKVRRAVLTELAREGLRYVPVGISSRHIHLSSEDLQVLFGPGFALEPLRPLSQPGQFAAKQCLTIEGPKGRIDKVRVLGPVRKETQVELAITDAFAIGLKDVPIRMSGNLTDTPGVKLIGPAGELQIKQGVIVAARHLHISEEQARAFKVHDGQVVSVKVGGARPCILENVICRAGKGHDLEIHIDTDEANACSLKNGDILELIVPGEECSCANEAGFDPQRIALKTVNALTGNKDRGADNPCMKTEICMPQIDQNVLDLVTEQDVNEAVRRGDKQISCERKALITPAAADRAMQCAIEIVRVDKSRNVIGQSAAGNEEVLELITAQDLDVAFTRNKTQIYCTRDALITPSAKERILETGIKIIRV